MKKQVKGEVVVFASLLFILMITFVVGVMDATSLEMSKSQRRADMNRAMECIFAEYQEELMKHYDVFALDGGYGSSSYNVRNLTKRLEYYGIPGTKNSVKRIQLLTDNNCRPFVQQAAAFMKVKYGMNELADLFPDSESGWSRKEEESEQIMGKENDLTDSMNQMLEEEEGSLSDVDNPMTHVSGLKSRPLLELVLPKDRTVSEKTLAGTGALTKRNLNRGKGDFSDEDSSLGAGDKLLFKQYLIEHYGNFVDPSHGNDHLEEASPKAALDYELEYLIVGKDSDRENLNKVTKKLLALRFVPNYTYLQSDGEKRAEAEAMAATLSTIVLSPELTELIAQGILLAWAYGESVMDIRSLLEGHSVPMVKTAASWQLSLSSLLKLGTDSDRGEGKHTPDGMDYGEYLRVLLLLEPADRLGKRALTIAELNMQKEYGCPGFRADNCVEKLECASTSSFRRGVRYKYQIYFGYR